MHIDCETFRKYFQLDKLATNLHILACGNSKITLFYVSKNTELTPFQYPLT